MSDANNGGKSRKKVRVDECSQVDYLRQELRAVHREIRQARASKSFQALAALRRQARAYRDDLDRLEQDQSQRQFLEMDEEALLHRLEVAMKEWPESWFELALRVYGDRHRGRLVFVDRAREIAVERENQGV